MLAEIRKWATLPPAGQTTLESGRDLMLETERGLQISGSFYAPHRTGRLPAVLLVGGEPALAEELVRSGNVVLALTPRGLPAGHTHNLVGDWITDTRALLIGRDLADMRTGDIIHGVDWLASRAEVDTTAIRAAARGVPGVWLLMAAAIDPRISRIWLDRTPRSLRAALDNPLSRDLHDAVIPGFALHWDLSDLVQAIAPRGVIWSDPTDWMQTVQPHLSGYRYRNFGEPDAPFLADLTK
jgi:hypothetical protein